MTCNIPAYVTRYIHMCNANVLFFLKGYIPSFLRRKIRYLPSVVKVNRNRSPLLCVGVREKPSNSITHRCTRVSLWQYVTCKRAVVAAFCAIKFYDYETLLQEVNAHQTFSRYWTKFSFGKIKKIIVVLNNYFPYERNYI